MLRLVGLQIHPTARLYEGIYLGRNLTLGRHVVINCGAFIDGSAPVTIEEYTRLGPHVRILTGTHEYRRSDVRRWPSDPCIAKPVRIERGCWLGMGAMVLPGVTIREGCIIAAGAVVIQDTLPHGLYAGVPAKRVKDLPVEEKFCE